ncbi:dihydroorotase [Demequina aurantiaca]|uniref:dihydroorotase n=1 Tax=Demequina aurantiaca TaxID=676200 RepID=UPI003D335442
MSQSTTTQSSDNRAVVIENASLLGESPTSIVIEDALITLVRGADEPLTEAEIPAGAARIDASGLVALPGLVDIHTHLREPGREDAETIESGSRSAAQGGFVAVFAMANTTPTADTAGVVEQVWSRGREIGLVDVYPIGAVTVGLNGTQLSEMGAMAMSRARVRMFSDDGKCVHDPVVMRRALEYVKTFDGVIAQHSQDPRLTEGSQMHEGVVSAELGLTGWPAVAEESIIARDVLLAKHVGSRLHVCHVSTAGSVRILRWAKAEGIDVTAEVMPHHLLLTEESVRGYDPRFKVNPPLRTQEDVDAVRAALADGTIDIVATDHAPHPDEDKDCEWGAAAMGMIGLETAVGIVQKTMVDSGLMTWADVAHRMSELPARIGRVEEVHGRPVAVGEPANITLVDPDAAWTVDPTATQSRSNNSPFGGIELPGRAVATILRGKPTYLDTRFEGASA